jgi:hypothetical protein
MTAIPGDKRQQLRREEREAFIKRLGLEYPGPATGGNPRYQSWQWPKAKNDSAYDRTVLLVIYEDESWRPYLNSCSAGTMGLGHEASLRAMVKLTDGGPQ